MSVAGIMWRKEKPNQRKMTNTAGKAWRNKTEDKLNISTSQIKTKKKSLINKVL